MYGYPVVLNRETCEEISNDDFSYHVPSTFPASDRGLRSPGASLGVQRVFLSEDRLRGWDDLLCELRCLKQWQRHPGQPLEFVNDPRCHDLSTWRSTAF